jgi:hypothetical protein
MSELGTAGQRSLREADCNSVCSTLRIHLTNRSESILSLEFDSLAKCGLVRLGVQSFIGLHSIAVDDQLQRRVGSVGIGRVSEWRLKGDYCPRFGAQCLGQVKIRA